jgi:hypothetical protein
MCAWNCQEDYQKVFSRSPIYGFLWSAQAMLALLKAAAWLPYSKEGPESIVFWLGPPSDVTG